MHSQLFPGGRLLLQQGDLTAQQVDAIVNAANPSLLGGGGVDGAIHRKGGPDILEECKEIRRTLWRKGLDTGKVAITTAGNLPARFVIHTVGPVYKHAGAQAPALLRSCVDESLLLAQERQLQSIAFPAISTGAFGYPMEEAATIILSAIADFLQHQEATPKDIRLILFDPAALVVFEQVRRQLFPA